MPFLVTVGDVIVFPLVFGFVSQSSSHCLGKLCRPLVSGKALPGALAVKYLFPKVSYTDRAKGIIIVEILLFLVTTIVPSRSMILNCPYRANTRMP